jgi:hypothetical protein
LFVDSFFCQGFLVSNAFCERVAFKFFSACLSFLSCLSVLSCQLAFLFAGACDGHGRTNAACAMDGNSTRPSRACKAITALTKLNKMARGISYRKSILISLIKLKNHICLLTWKLQLDCNKK